MRRYTAGDRPQFRRDQEDLLRRLAVQPGEVDQDTLVVCTRAEDFDPADNVLWELEANRSAPRPDVDVVVGPP